jgi:hypothetical protein
MTYRPADMRARGQTFVKLCQTLAGFYDITAVEVFRYDVMRFDVVVPRCDCCRSVVCAKFYGGMSGDVNIRHVVRIASLRDARTKT